MLHLKEHIGPAALAPGPSPSWTGQKQSACISSWREGGWEERGVQHTPGQRWWGRHLSSRWAGTAVSVHNPVLGKAAVADPAPGGTGGGASMVYILRAVGGRGG